ncbi:MAG: respiratory nitrate reductase subunit gamma [Cyanobacteria bacterium NC_groundwater_1444_Ag_S-0.65um_54_12]|nr:respiratory nitrate reductase subunit gamma [Cyanobacteria bacterium NC_groundwater_1444_Ag_S-0.65um_54_12]
MSDIMLLAVFPYLAVMTALGVGIYRYLNDRFSYSSLSSQFLEARALFWGSVSWHYAILLILSAHILALLFPSKWAALVGEPVRRYVLEISGLGLAIVAVGALIILIARRLTNRRVFMLTSKMDWLLLLVLLLQVLLGFYLALVYRWGSVWYLHTAVPWIASLFWLKPQIEFVSHLPLLVKLHFAGAFLLVFLFPFSRLVHFVTVPLGYLWRPYQLVIWNRHPLNRKEMLR